MNGYTRFVLLRHGEAEGNRELRYLGATDAPLTTLGREQASQLAQAAVPLKPSAIYSSPLARAHDTARALAAATGLEVTDEPALREMDFGAWEGLTQAEVRAHDPRELAAWEAGADIAPPAGESLEAVRLRVTACADRLAAQHSGDVVALVSHGGPIKALVCAALGLPVAGARRMWLDPASMCIVEWQAAGQSAGFGMLRVFNAVGHLLVAPRWQAGAKL